MINHLVNYLSNSIHHNRPKSYEDLPCIVEEDNIWGGRNVGDVDIAGHKSNWDSGKQSGQDEANNLVRGKEENGPAGDVGDGGENEHPPRADQLLKEAAKHRNDDLGVVFRGAWCNN